MNWCEQVFGPLTTNWPLVVVAIVGIYVAWRTLKAIEGQLKAMQDQLKQMEGSGKQTDELIRQAAAQATQTGIAARAAKTSADIAANVSIPILAIESFEVVPVGAANLAAMLQYPQVKMSIKNYGQTPAFLKWWTIIFTCEHLPGTPVYEGYPCCGMILEKVVVEPNKSYTLPELGFPHRQEIPLTDVQAVIDRAKILNAYGYICYGDLFGNPLRRLKFCETALNLSGNEGEPWIQWVSGLAPAVYQGTEQFPFKRSASRPEAESQAMSTDTKAEDRLGEAN